MAEDWQTAWRDYYDDLKCRYGDSQDAIESAYKTLRTALHPDKHRDSPQAIAEATKRFIEVQVAYRWLGTADRRREYDAAYAARIRKESVPRLGTAIEATATERHLPAERPITSVSNRPTRKSVTIASPTTLQIPLSSSAIWTGRISEVETVPSARTANVREGSTLYWLTALSGFAFAAVLAGGLWLTVGQASSRSQGAAAPVAGAKDEVTSPTNQAPSITELPKTMPAMPQAKPAPNLNGSSEVSSNAAARPSVQQQAPSQSEISPTQPYAVPGPNQYVQPAVQPLVIQARPVLVPQVQPPPLQAIQPQTIPRTSYQQPNSSAQQVVQNPRPPNGSGLIPQLPTPVIH